MSGINVEAFARLVRNRTFAALDQRCPVSDERTAERLSGGDEGPPRGRHQKTVVQTRSPAQLAQLRKLRLVARSCGPCYKAGRGARLTQVACPGTHSMKS